MPNMKHICMFLFLLALKASQEIPLAEGMQLKPMKDQESCQVKIETGLQNHAKQATKVNQNLRSHEGDQHVNGKNKTSPRMIPTQNHEFGSSEVSDSDAFHPKAQGKSPGIGHHFAGQKQNMQPNVQDFTSVEGGTDGFKPTGHSPGVGHSFGNMKEEPNT